jgi:hypothetical protein
MYLYDPAGQLVAQGAGVDKQRTLGCTALTAGAYKLRASLIDGKRAGYTLSITY